MGNSRWFFSFSGAILAAGAIAIADARDQLRHRLRVGHADHDAAASRPASVDQVRDTLDPLGYADAKIQKVNDPELGKNVFQISVPSSSPAQVDKVEHALDKRLRRASGRLLAELDRADLRRSRSRARR